MVRAADSGDMPALTAAVQGVDAMLISASAVGQLRVAGAAGNKRKNTVTRCSHLVRFTSYHDIIGHCSQRGPSCATASREGRSVRCRPRAERKAREQCTT